MPALEAIETKIRRLQEQAEAMRAKKAAATLDRIVALMTESGISVDDIQAHIGGKKRGAKTSSKKTPAGTATVAAKYQDPKSGATWSGRGRAPAWIANAKNRDRFLVHGNAVGSSTSVASKVKKQGNYVRGPQPAKYRDPETGATWSGRGRAPAWVANAQDRATFLVAAGGKVDAAVKTTRRKSKGKPTSPAASHTRKGQPKGVQPAKYLNPETGATWSGRGPAPEWLAAAGDRSQFLIHQDTAQAGTT